MLHSPDELIASLVHGLQAPEFDHLLMNRLKGFIPSDLSMIFVYDDGRLDHCVADEGLSTATRDSYAAATYRHSPFFQHHLRGFEDGVYRMEDLVRTAFVRKPAADSPVLAIDPGEEIGYVTAGWPKRLTELDIAVRLSGSQTAQISLYRRSSRFSDRDIARIGRIQKSLSAIFQNRWAGRGRTRAAGAGALPGSLDALSASPLSPREREVVGHTVAGLSSKEIARALLISPETVRTHRQRAFAKLGVATRVELFGKLLASRHGGT